MKQDAADSIFVCRDLTLDVSHQGDSKTILRDISFAVSRGEFFTLVGGSGTGKTTLLRVLSGLAPQSAGTLTYRDKAIAGPPEGVVMVFQDYSHALLQWRTVARNVALGLENKLSGEALRERVMGALQLVGLEANADDHPWQLSGGMQQRVQIARALALEPDVLLMDEPFGALDAMTKASLQDELLKVHEKTGASFVFVTHDIEEAVYLGDRVAVLGGPPGHVAQTFQIDLPRPRHQLETRQLKAFMDYRRDIHEAIVTAIGSDS